MEGMSGREIGKMMIGLQVALYASADGKLTRKMTDKVLNAKVQLCCNVIAKANCFSPMLIATSSALMDDRKM